ncbi:MAG: helix-turn-helix transcriptional regulator [Phycisphaerales bacterium]|nr:helix-turn-helix transcriptional regulator [Phycisphaerales bacterium]
MEPELAVLAVLSEESLYGYAITKAAAARSRGEIKLGPGVLYPLLAGMEKQGLILSTWEAVKADPDDEAATGRRRKWYRLSAKGRKRLEQRIKAHREYHAMMEAFLEGGSGLGRRAEGAKEVGS